MRGETARRAVERQDAGQVDAHLEVLDARVVVDVEEVGPLLNERAGLDDLRRGEVGVVDHHLVVRAGGVRGQSVGGGGCRGDSQARREGADLLAGAEVGDDIPAGGRQRQVREAAGGVAVLKEAKADGARQDDLLAAPSPRRGGPRRGQVQRGAARRADDDESARAALVNQGQGVL